MRIGVDLMGSESSPTVLFEAVLNAAKTFSSEDSLVVYATHAGLQQILCEEKFRSIFESKTQLIDLHLVQEEILMDDDPLSAIRLKKASSIVVGMKQLNEGRIDAFVSSGNTGAIVGSASFNLPKFKGIERPCLLASFPSREAPLAIVDVGGFLSTTAKQLVQYAKIGAAYQRVTLEKSFPTVGLVNIGVESKKGSPELREAYRLLSEEAGSLFQFIGNVEGREAFQGDIDVLVTDGFTGNVMLKVSQGVSSFIFDYLQDTFKESATEEMLQLFTQVRNRFMYDEYPGALLCGVKGVVMKCHGAATVKAMFQSILGAKKAVENQLISQLSAAYVSGS